MMVALAAMMICLGASAIDKVVKKTAMTGEVTSVENLASATFMLQNGTGDEAVVLYTPSGWDIKVAPLLTAIAKQDNGGFYKLEAVESHYRIPVYNIDKTRRTFWAGNQSVNAQPEGSVIFGLSGEAPNYGQDGPNLALWDITYVEGSGFAFHCVGRDVFIGHDGTAACPSNDSVYWRAYTGYDAVYDAAELSAAYDAALAAVKTSDDKDALEAAAEIYEADSDLEKYGNAINAVIDAINACEALNATYANLDESGAIVAAEVLAKYNSGDYKNANELMAAYREAIKAQTTAGSDFTGLIINPTIDGADGWTIDRPVGGNGPLLNSVSFEYWSYTEGKGGFDYWQEITGLPNGTYTITADMYNDQVVPSGNTFAAAAGVYGTSGTDTQMALVDVQGATFNTYTTPAVKVSNGTLRLGIKNANADNTMPARWFVADNFKLTLVELTPTYAVTVAEGIENGTVSADPTVAEAGETITLTITPNDDYELDELTVMAGETPVTVTDNTFVMPASAVTVSATFKEISTAPTSYVVTVAEGITNGSVDASPTEAAEGETITLTITPAEGYELDELTVMAGETPVTVTDNTFVMPASAVTVSATFKEKAVEPEPDPSSYIVNAAFNPAADPKGWTENVTGFSDYGMGLIGTFVVRDGGAAATVDETHLNTEFCAGVQCRWSTNYTNYLQTTSALPAGDYVLTFDVENVNAATTKASYDNRFTVTVGENVYTDKSTEWMNGKSAWTEHSIYFTVAESAPVTISLGYGTGTNNIGSNNTPYLYVSHLQLAKYIPTLYAITIAEMENGSVEASPEEAAAGETVTLTITPADGYELDELTVMNGETPVTVTDKTFVMPDAAVTVSATFKAASPVIADGKYYIYNVGTEKYLAAGADWGTHTVVNAAGLDYGFTRADGKYTIDSQVQNKTDQHFLNGEWNDGVAMGWIFNQVSEGVWTISNGTNFLTAQESGVVTLADDPSVAAAQWKLKTLANRLEELAAATPDAPVDATFLIADANFGRNDLRKSAWTMQASNQNLSGGNNVNNCAESYHATFTLSQVIADAPAGKYKLTAQGFYRQDQDNNKQDVTEDAPVFYANSETAAFSPRIGTEGSMSDASTSFTNGNYTIEPIEVTVFEKGQLTIGAKGTASYQWVIFDNFCLTYLSSEVPTDEFGPAYAAALSDAQTALKNEAYAAVTGDEKTALTQAIADYETLAEPSVALYQEAISALTQATEAFTGAKSAYEALIAAKADVDTEAWPYASAAKKTAVMDAIAVEATSAEDATAKTAAIAKAYRQFVESNALAEGVEGAVNMTDKITNPTAEEAIASPWVVVKGEGSGGALDVKNNEPWTDGSDNSTHKYFDGGNWGAQSWDVSLEQEITLEAGKYLLTAIARASGDVAFSLYAGETKVTIPAIGATGGVFNRGWNDQFVEFEVEEAGAIKIGVQGVVQDHQYNWMSFSNFRLVQLEAAPVPEIALNAPTFNVEEGTQAEPNMLPAGSTLKITYTADNLAENGVDADDVMVRMTVLVSGDLPENVMNMASETKHSVMGETFYIPLGETDFPVALKDGYVYQNIVVMAAALVKQGETPAADEVLATYAGEPAQLHWVGLEAPATATYAITVADDIEGGEVEADVEEAAEGAKVTLTITPNQDYKLGTVTVSYVEGDSETKYVEVAADNTFIMPAAPVNVSATFIYVDPNLIEIAQSQSPQIQDGANRADVEEGDGYTQYTTKELVSVIIKMYDVDVTDCDYVVIKFAEPLPNGICAAFWAQSSTDNIELDAGISEYKYVFANDTKCAIQNGVLPQITLLTLWNPGKVVKISGVYKHLAEEPDAIDAIETAEDVKADGKYMENGKLVIIKNGHKYNASGLRIK
jgi:hypothetical protein